MEAGEGRTGPLAAGVVLSVVGEVAAVVFNSSTKDCDGRNTLD